MEHFLPFAGIYRSNIKSFKQLRLTGLKKTNLGFVIIHYKSVLHFIPALKLIYHIKYNFKAWLRGKGSFSFSKTY